MGAWDFAEPQSKQIWVSVTRADTERPPAECRTQLLIVTLEKTKNDTERAHLQYTGAQL